MRIFALVWVVCYLGLFLLTLIGIVTSLIWFRQLERAYPAVFDRSGYLVSKSQRLRQYWGHILSAKYKDLDDPGLRAKCTFLRVFAWVYLVDLVIAFAGIFIVRPT